MICQIVFPNFWPLDYGNPNFSFEFWNLRKNQARSRFLKPGIGNLGPKMGKVVF